MSDSDKPSMQWGRQAGAAGTSPVIRWWRRIWNSASRRAPWLQGNTPGGSPSGPGRSRFPIPRHAGTWMVLIWVILVCMPIAGLVLGYIRRPAAGTSGISTGTSPFDSGTDTNEKKPKPSPAKPMLPVSQAPPPTVTRPTPSLIEPVTPPPIATPAGPTSPGAAPAPTPTAPLPPAAPPGAKPAFAAVSYPARHDKHFGDQCAGQLTLNSSGLYFNCPGSPDEGVNAAINQIDDADDNGIRLLSGKKYHFTISGMSRSDERQLFANWLSQVR